jgi:hypothetical protein
VLKHESQIHRPVALRIAGEQAASGSAMLGAPWNTKQIFSAVIVAVIVQKYDKVIFGDFTVLPHIHSPVSGGPHHAPAKIPAHIPASVASILVGDCFVAYRMLSVHSVQSGNASVLAKLVVQH